MPPRILTAADAPAIQATLDGLAPMLPPGTVQASSLFAPLPAGQRAIVIGDPPVFARILYYQIADSRQWMIMSPGLAALLAASGGFCSQVTHMGSFSATDPSVSAKLIPHLATALAAISAKAPAAQRATIRGAVVWACFDGVPTTDAVKLVAQMKAVFPLAQTDGAYIWMPTLQGAASAVAASAVLV